MVMAGAAEVDHRDERVGGVEPVGPVADQPDLAVERPQPSVAQAELDRGEHARLVETLSTAAPCLWPNRKASRVPIGALLLDPPSYLETAKVFDMLLALPKYGRVKAIEILQSCRVSPSKTFGGLSERQRAELAGRLHLSWPTCST
jgi:hypothetical protein